MLINLNKPAARPIYVKKQRRNARVERRKEGEGNQTR
jgi:hypothetical protein